MFISHTYKKERKNILRDYDQMCPSVEDLTTCDDTPTADLSPTLLSRVRVICTGVYLIGWGETEKNGKQEVVNLNCNLGELFHRLALNADSL